MNTQPYYIMFARSLLIALCLGIQIPATFAQAPSSAEDPVLGAQQKISVWSYTNAFAKRFSLPEMTDDGLPPDIFAMEFRIIRDTHDSLPYECILNVYLNNKLNILYPEGEVGSAETLNIGGRFPKGSGRMTRSEDRVFFGEQSGKYTMKASFFSHSQKSSLGGTITYKTYRKYFLSEIAYLSFSIGTCSSVGDPQQYKTFLWIEKESGRDYRHWTQLDPKDFYEFPIPKELITKIYPHAHAAAEKNAAYFSSENKKRREEREQAIKQSYQK